MRQRAGVDEPTLLGMVRGAENRGGASRAAAAGSERVCGSFHGKLRDECLNASCFTNLFEARAKTGAWKEEYNEERPYSSLGYPAPREFARRVAALRSPTAPCQRSFEERKETEIMS